MKAKKILTTVISLMMCACMLFAVSACNTDNGIAVTDIELSNTSITMNVGDKYTLTAMVMPANATNTKERWVSDNADVVTVDKGEVTAVGAGNARVKVTIGGKSAICKVTVNSNSGESVMVSSISLNKELIKLDPNNTEKLIVSFNPTNATNRSVVWRSTDDNVATVGSDGTVKAIAGGVAVITATVAATVGSGIMRTDYCVVQVSGEPAEVENELYVSKVSSLASRQTDFIMGMDASAVPSIEAAREASNSPLYKNFDGVEEDVFKILKDNGITDIRIRIWNDPTDGNGNSYGGGNCDLENAVNISERCAAVGLGVIIDFHYSDFWADPGKYTVPKAWANIVNDTSAMVEAIRTFTTECLTAIKNTGVKITMVQIGNETNRGMAGSTDWSVICQYMNAGSQAVRAVTGAVANGGAKVAVHFTNPESGSYSNRAQTLKNNNVDYDVFGTSYYPYWHGTLSNLSTQLSNVHNQFGKEVMVLETSYAFTYEEADGTGNTALTTITQPVTVQGQANAVRSVIETVANLGEWGLGVCYWEGTWIAASSEKSSVVNADGLCLEYGCGWASQYAHSYDNDAPTKGGGGCVIDNQAFWSSVDGTPNESLKVFKLVYTGQTGSLKADLLTKQQNFYTVDVGSIELPATVSVVLNNGSSLSVPAYWAVTAEQLEDYIHEVGTHVITGTTDYGGICVFEAWVMNPNLLVGGSFEADEDITGYPSTDYFIQSSGLGEWKLDYTQATKSLQLYVSTDAQNARAGTQSFHFWDEGTVSFTLSQTLTAAQLGNTGKFGGYFEIQGDDGSKVNIHMYVTIKYADGHTETINGDVIDHFDGWEHWQMTSLTGVEIDSTVVSVEVGISVYAEFAGNGPWGNIDNCQFYLEG